VIDGKQAADLVLVRVAEGLFETWFEHDDGRLLAIVTNGARAMVMVLDEPGDAGEHAIDPTATGQQSGYVLSTDSTTPTTTLTPSRWNKP